jgi:hypothetical protein
MELREDEVEKWWGVYAGALARGSHDSAAACQADFAIKNLRDRLPAPASGGTGTAGQDAKEFEGCVTAYLTNNGRWGNPSMSRDFSQPSNNVETTMAWVADLCRELSVPEGFTQTVIIRRA